MCGRFALYSSFAAIKEYADLLNEIEELMPNYNITPGSIIPIIKKSKQGKILDFAKWGLVPFWAKDPKIGNRMINSKAETIIEKPSFKSAFRYRRCLIPANGFFEWSKQEKQPFYISVDQRPIFSFAGIYEIWHADDGSTLESCSIITTSPNQMIENLHARMPAILTQKEEEIWLSENDPQLLMSLLHPYRELLRLYPVSRKVNSPQNNDEQLIEEVNAQN
jgi:putative SOS response-associated peptidase YedK